MPESIAFAFPEISQRQQRTPVTEAIRAIVNLKALFVNGRTNKQLGDPDVQRELSKSVAKLLAIAIDRADSDEPFSEEWLTEARRVPIRRSNSDPMELIVRTALALIAETIRAYRSGQVQIAWTYAMDAMELCRDVSHVICFTNREFLSSQLGSRAAHAKHADARRLRDEARRLYAEGVREGSFLSKDQAAEVLTPILKKQFGQGTFRTVRKHLKNA
ncbi:hypothetical protein C7S18_05600 [Ahniella affigens]|uniref:Uncharacterized protein n=1 Tax=Ahniella affigens TaxID=2021234 RepID=A0A2P1PPE1_9GAMM|nr:hypothetical protein [Ahniella affigens]AVP96707.1 hypothetical protein C7S18_05600 [Ahniella affigens]